MDFSNPFNQIFSFNLNEFDTMSDMSIIEASVKVVLRLIDFDL